MTPNMLVLEAAKAIEAGTNMTLVLPRPFKNRPKGFPKGELLCEQPNSNVYSYDPEKILKWLGINSATIVSKSK